MDITGGYQSNCFKQDGCVGDRHEEEVMIDDGDIPRTPNHQSGLEMMAGMGGGDSLVSDKETDTFIRRPGRHDTPETSIGRFFSRYTDKTSTPIISNKLLLDSDVTTNPSPTARGHHPPTNHTTNHQTSLPTTPTPANHPSTNQPKKAVRAPKPTMVVARDRRKKAKCSYVDGICNQHGPGAKLRWKPTGVKTTNPDGRPELGKDFYYECEVSVGLGGRRFLQPKISSLMTPGTIKKTQEDTQKTISFATHSVGQDSNNDEQSGMAGIIQHTERTG